MNLTYAKTQKNYSQIGQFKEEKVDKVDTMSPGLLVNSILDWLIKVVF